MGKNSSIEWTHHTFNPWWGCVKVSKACTHCYAEAWAKRVGESVWGRKAPRRFFGDDHWRQPIKWNEEAAKEHKRRRVFCASMADVFEVRADLDPWREKLWALIDETPHLDWLLLTKRIESVSMCVPWGKAWPENVWLGTTTENQKCADERIPHLISIPARTRFLSCEPLLGPLSIARWMKKGRLHWIIAGGESGPQSRPMHPDWARSLRDQCVQGHVPFHFKQWGHWSPLEAGNSTTLKQLVLESEAGEPVVVVMRGKKDSGRLLDGRTWDQFPKPCAA